MQTSNWPEQWKRGILVPLHMKDNHRDIKNYRPITILAAVDKVFEPRDTIYRTLLEQ